MRIIIIGAPGTGKGTQASLMAEQYGVPLLSTTEAFRTAVSGSDAIGRQAKAIMDSGRGIGDELTLAILEERVVDIRAKKGFILDAYPRNIPQAEALDQMLSHHDLFIDAVILMEIDAELLIERLVGRRSCRSCGQRFNIFIAPPRMEGQCDYCGGRLSHRADDNEESISNRLRIFETQTVPLLQYYEQQESLYRIDGSGSIAEVQQRIQTLLSQVPKRISKPPMSEVKAVFEKLRQATRVELDLDVDSLDHGDDFLEDEDLMTLVKKSPKAGQENKEGGAAHKKGDEKAAASKKSGATKKKPAAKKKSVSKRASLEEE